MRKVVLTSTWSVLGFKAAKFCRPEQNIEFDPRLIRPHAAILKEPITEKDSLLYRQFIVFRNEFYRKYFLPRERST